MKTKRLPLNFAVPPNSVSYDTGKRRFAEMKETLKKRLGIR